MVRDSDGGAQRVKVSIGFGWYIYALLVSLPALCSLLWVLVWLLHLPPLG